MRFGKTVDRRVIGSMNEFAFEHDFFIGREGGLDSVNILGVNREINRTSLSPLKNGYPLDALKNLLLGS
jgi:hypothetical protein